MKSFYLFIFLSFYSLTFAQIHEIGVFLGGSNYVGDVGKTNYIAPNELAFGILYKWNKSPRHAYRFSYMQSKITANDLDSKNLGRNLRGYNFENSIKEVSAGLEFNFFEFNLHEFGQRVTPYVFSGVTYFAYDEQFVLDGKARQDYSSSAFALPMIIGVKSNITPSLILAAEVGARYTFTDNLDASNPANENLKTLRFGNQNNNDWYIFSGFTLTYTFGDKPCYCND
jgi:hypothetical protein